MYKSIQMMNNIVANKVWLIRQLHLPIELADEISSYCFYDPEVSNIRNKLRSIVEVFSYPLKHGRTILGEWWFLAKYGEKQFQAHNCTRCGNYIVTNNYDITDRVLCECVYREDEEDEYEVSIEDIQREEEDYRNYREGRREIIEGW